MPIPISDEMHAEFVRLADKAEACRRAADRVAVKRICEQVLVDLADNRESIPTEFAMRMALALPTAMLESSPATTPPTTRPSAESDTTVANDDSSSQTSSALWSTPTVSLSRN